MKLLFIILLNFLLALTVAGQSDITQEEYKIYNFILKKQFADHRVDKSNGKTKQSKIHYGTNNLTDNKYLDLKPEDYNGVVSTDFYSEFLKLNEKVYSLDTAKCTQKVFSDMMYTFVWFSRCYIKDGHAMVYVGEQYDLSEGEGSIYILQKNKETGEWIILRSIGIWIS